MPAFTRACAAAGRSSRAIAHNDADAFDERLRRGARRGTGRDLDRCREHLQHGRRQPEPRRSDGGSRSPRCHPDVDEAHATGVAGPQGRGLAAAFEGRRNVITLHTCGKALGRVGGFVLAPRVIRDFLVNRARPFIFATAPSPLVAAITRAALGISATRPRRRERLAALVGFRRPGAAAPLRPRAVGIAYPAGHRRRRSRPRWRSRPRCSGAASTCARSGRRRWPKAPRGCASR